MSNVSQCLYKIIKCLKFLVELPRKKQFWEMRIQRMKIQRKHFKMRQCICDLNVIRSFWLLTWISHSHKRILRLIIISAYKLNYTCKSFVVLISFICKMQKTHCKWWECNIALAELFFYTSAECLAHYKMKFTLLWIRNKLSQNKSNQRMNFLFCICLCFCNGNRWIRNSFIHMEVEVPHFANFNKNIFFSASVNQTFMWMFV